MILAISMERKTKYNSINGPLHHFFYYNIKYNCSRIAKAIVFFLSCLPRCAEETTTTTRIANDEDDDEDGIHIDTKLRMHTITPAATNLFSLLTFLYLMYSRRMVCFFPKLLQLLVAHLFGFFSVSVFNFGYCYCHRRGFTHCSPLPFSYNFFIILLSLQLLAIIVHYNSVI